MPGTGNAWSLLLCAAGIYCVYLYQGIVFEALHKTDFVSNDGLETARWLFPQFLLLCTLFGNIIVAVVMLIILRPSASIIPQLDFIRMSIPSLGAAGLVYMSMSRVDYPTLTLFKASKPLAILLVAFLARQNELYTRKQKIQVFAVTCGLIIFFGAREGGDAGSLITFSQAALGYVGLIGSLLCDGAVALAVVRITNSPVPPSQFSAQAFVNMWSLLFVFSFALASGRLITAIDFVIRFPAVRSYLLQLGLMSGVGQLFIFATMRLFDPLVLSLVTTTRKVFSIIISTILFAHQVNVFQWLGVTVVFTGLLFRDLRKLLFPLKIKTEEFIV